jgi:predicted phosphodiesterase
MRYAIIGDIHSNLAAFIAVLQDLEKEGGFNRIWCLGDVVGYGPEPNACIKLLKQYDHICIAGNHDRAAVGNIDIMDFNADAATANKWTTEKLTEADKDYLVSLKINMIEENFTMVHGSPKEPIWEYLLSARAAEENLNFFNTPFCLVGHSHIPLAFEYSNNQVVLRQLCDGAIIKLGKNRLIINPGSVGQPRDHDPRASYAVYDNEAMIIYHHRVEYDIEATQEKMAEQNLPEFLIQRLSHGL